MWSKLRDPRLCGSASLIGPYTYLFSLFCFPRAKGVRSESQSRRVATESLYSAQR